MGRERYFHNHGLFAPSYFERVLSDPGFPRRRSLPPDAEQRLSELQQIWEQQRAKLIMEPQTQDRRGRTSLPGIPDGWEPLPGSTEAQVENQVLGPICSRVLGYSVEQNRTLLLRGAAAEEVATAAQRPDFVLFPDADTHERILTRFGTDGIKGHESKAPDGVKFCEKAALILDAKRFEKGVGADEIDEPGRKKCRSEPTALDDLRQVDRYLRGYSRPWGVLTNGRCWRLMRQGRLHEHLRFDLVLFLEDLRGRESTQEDMEVFALFWYLFGPPAVQGGYLHDLERESQAQTARVRDVLRVQAHAAVQEIARGFWGCRSNYSEILPTFPTLPNQRTLDRLREVSLTLLYRLLFILKAEAQNLLPMVESLGGDTAYKRRRSTIAIFKALEELSGDDRARYSDVYDRLQALFDAVERGDPQFGIPAYDGGLFDPLKHQELARWKLLDESLYQVLKKLIYLEGSSRPVPYEDLDVRDLGDIYEGLLEQRLEGRQAESPFLVLKNQKGERKASGSYFTPEGLVDHLVRQTLVPLLDACQNDPGKVLSLRILDPAMGSGHFLVKAVDVMADYLTMNCDPEEPGAPNDNGPAERAYWKRLVVENCIYGVDANPMAVELARVALWLYTAEYGKPLSFLDHHLKVGNSLVGVALDRLSAPGMKLKQVKGELTWVPVAAPVVTEVGGRTDSVESGATGTNRSKKSAPGQILLPFSLDTGLFSGILASIRGILARRSDSARDVKEKSQAYAQAVGTRLAAHRLLADLWCLQWFLDDVDAATVEAYESPDGLYAKVKKACGIQLDDARERALTEFSGHALVRKVVELRTMSHASVPLAFFHWQLEFPEVAFDESGRPRPGFGFDAVVGNPPWDRIRPERRHFYGPWGRPDEGPDWDVANTQGPSLDALIRRLHAVHPELEAGWRTYVSMTKALTQFLRASGTYRHQAVLLEGKRTGGDPDLFRFFVERAVSALRTDGRLGLVVPGTLWQAEGCTGLRRLLLTENTPEEIYGFENYRKWAFDIDSRFKFTALVVQRTFPKSEHVARAAFMLRDLRALRGALPERLVNLSVRAIEALSPGTLSLLDLASDGDAQLVSRLHLQHKPLGDCESGWNVTYRREMDMTTDAWRFKKREWMERRGFLQIQPVRDVNGAWTQQRRFGSPTAKYPEILPPGGEYWVAPDSDWYRARGYLEREAQVGQGRSTVFVHPEDAAQPVERKIIPEDSYRIIPGAIYTALYEGRMVHNFDHAQKAYVSGEGRQAVWTDIPIDEKRLVPRVFATAGESGEPLLPRLAFCDVTGATNERTTLAAMLPRSSLAGNKVPTLSTGSLEADLGLEAVLNSFVWDWMVRFRISTTMNWTYISRVVVPEFGTRPELWDEAAGICALLSCTTPESAEVWQSVYPEEAWSYASARRSALDRAELRARLDAIMADLYGLSVFEYARLLTTFPLLDRDQPSLDGDFFVTECDDEPTRVERKDWVRTPHGLYELKPRSFITRDLALLTYMKRKGFPPPQDLHAFYLNEVGIDPEGPLSRFRIGKVTDLLDRVHLARELGAVAYIPSVRGTGVDKDGDAGEEDDEATDN